MNVILLERAELDDCGVATLSGLRVRHIREVLKAAVAQQIRVGVVDGPMGVATITSLAGDSATLQCALDAFVPVLPSVDLLLALPRPKVLRRLWAQIAALGVGRILLTNAERVERQYFDTHLLAPDGYRPLLIEGLQQARDTRLPQVTVHRQLKVLIEDLLDGLCPNQLRLIADPSVDASPGRIVAGSDRARVLLAIGPEGGWNDFERRLFNAHGFEAVGIGVRTLRTDTACIALLAVVNAALTARDSKISCEKEDSLYHAD